MRADRLISILMLLQTHERMTAEVLAKQVEVSTRTIYRDIIALNMAGVPIYTDRGPGGGFTLLESYRTSLTGMSADETRALFMLSIPDALVELGVGEKHKTALLKLAGSLPTGQRMVPTHAQQRIYLDSTPWIPQGKSSPHLEILHQAVWDNRLVRIVYQGSFDTQIEIVLSPLGLVSKMNTWYLVGSDNDHLRVIRVADILQVNDLGQTITRERDFDLPGFWKAWCKDVQGRRPVYPVKLRIAPQLISKLHLYLGEEVKYSLSEVSPDDGAWREVTIFYEHFFLARQSILNLGRAAEVLEPEALRLGVIDFAHQIVDFYHTE